MSQQYFAERPAAALKQQPGRPVTVGDLHEHMAELARQHQAHWRKGSAEPAAIRELTAASLRRLAALGLVRVAGGMMLAGDTVQPRPALARFGYEEPVITGRQP